jgi:hypothetical protein
MHVEGQFDKDISKVIAVFAEIQDNLYFILSGLWGAMAPPALTTN